MGVTEGLSGSFEPVQNQLLEAQQRIAQLEAAKVELGRLQEELQASEQRYRTAFEYTGTAMMIVEEDTTVSMGNNRLEELTGFPQSESTRGHSWRDFVSDHDKKRLMEYHRLRRENPSAAPTEYEFRLKHRNGEHRDILMNVALIPGTKQSLISLLDITDRKKTLAALQESEKRYRELFENANDIIYTHDLEGTFTSCNTAAFRTYGFSPEEIGTVGIVDILDESEKERVFRKVAKKLEGESGSSPYEVLTRTRNGEEVWVEVNTRVMYDGDGKPVGIQGIARNITDRKRAERELQESEERFHETADILPACIADLDLELNFSYVNKRGLETFGYSPDHLQKGTINVRDIVASEDWGRALEDVSNILSEGYEYGALREYRMVRNDGRSLDMLVTGSPLMKSGEVAGLRFVLIDITERKRTEELVRQSERKFRGIFSQSPVGIGIFSRSGMALEINDSFRHLFRMERGQGERSLEDFTGELDAGLEELVPGRELRLETQRVVGSDNGSTEDLHDFEWHIARIGEGDDDENQTFLVQVMDVTERKQAERFRLREAELAAEKANRLVESLRKEMVEKAAFHNMVSRSPSMKAIFDYLPEMAQATATVLITGESGTGKELIARSLHELSPRSKKPFVAINCSALPDNLLESELFGYKAGAFTDAKTDKKGKFAVAEGGTIFLDEIGDISPAMQAKLLRVLQERAYEPLGAVSPVKANVRVVTATNKDLESMVKEGSFREDLYYRIKVLNVKLPPLRQRRTDIPLLCDHFIAQFKNRYAKKITGISDEALEVLLAHEFPGNIRELENTIEHAFIFCKQDTIEPSHLPPELVAPKAKVESQIKGELLAIRNFEELERFYIQAILEEMGGNKVRTAERLGIHKSSLYRRMRSLGLET